MNARTKSLLIIVATLIIGVAIGALSTGAILNQRVETLQALRDDPGFMFFLERVIEPTDEAQRAQIREVLTDAAEKRRELRRSMIEEHRFLFMEIREELDQILTSQQKEKLRAFMEQEMKRGHRRDGMPPGVRRGRPEGFAPDSGRALRRFAPRRQLSPDTLPPEKLPPDSLPPSP